MVWTRRALARAPTAATRHPEPCLARVLREVREQLRQRALDPGQGLGRGDGAARECLERGEVDLLVRGEEAVLARFEVDVERALGRARSGGEVTDRDAVVAQLAREPDHRVDEAGALGFRNVLGIQSAAPRGERLRLSGRHAVECMLRAAGRSVDCVQAAQPLRVGRPARGGKLIARI